MKNKRKSNYQSADINIYCFPFVLNKQNEYLCFFRNENETKEFTTTKTQRVYQRAQSFIYECLQEPEHREYFHNMVLQQLEKKGLLLEIEKRDDVLVNTFKSSNHSYPSRPNEINENR